MIGELVERLIDIFMLFMTTTLLFLMVFAWYLVLSFIGVI